MIHTSKYSFSNSFHKWQAASNPKSIYIMKIRKKKLLTRYGSSGRSGAGMEWLSGMNFLVFTLSLPPLLMIFRDIEKKYRWWRLSSGCKGLVVYFFLFFLIPKRNTTHHALKLQRSFVPWHVKTMRCSPILLILLWGLDWI